MQETRYTLRELRQLMTRKTANTHQYRHLRDGEVIRTLLGVSNTGARIIQEVRFTRENGETFVTDITTVL